MRLVLDTNVLVSAVLAPNSFPAKVLNWGEVNGIILYSSSTLEELISVLERPKFKKYIDQKDIDGLGDRIRRSWSLINIVKRVQLCRDVKDDKFLELALNGNASHLITGDTDLLMLHPFQEIPIIKPRTFYDAFLPS